MLVGGGWHGSVVLGCYDLSSVVLVGVVRQSPHAVDVMSLLEVYFGSSSKDVSALVVSVTSDVDG